MRKILGTIAGAALAVGLFAAPSQANACGAPGASGGTYVPAGGESGNGAVYAGNQGTNEGWVGEQSSRGYIEVRGSMSSGIRIHGSTTDNAVSGNAQVNPFGQPASVCVSGGGQTVRFPL